MRRAPRSRRLRDRDGQDAVLEIGGDRVDVDRFGQREGAREAAVAALDAVVLLARHVAVRVADARAADDDAAYLRRGCRFGRAPGPGSSAVSTNSVGGFVEIDRRRPAGRVGADELTELFVQREQIAQRIPARERHVSHRSTVGPAREPYVLRLQGYTDINMAHPFKRRGSAKGMLIKVGNDLFRILDLHHLTPGNKRAHIQVRMRNIRTLALADHKFRAEEDVERATLDEREMQYLYNDGDHYYFMDTSTYEQIHISRRGARRLEGLPDRRDRLIRVEFYDVEPVGIELPPTVDLVVKETVPGIKGATASAQVKPATLETGLVDPGAAVRQRRRQGPRQHRDRRVPVARLSASSSPPSHRSSMDVIRRQPQHGWIEVITGSMFSGKSEELIRRLRRAQIARQKVQIFKPLIDNRYSEDHIVSHSDMRIASQNVTNSDELRQAGRRRHRGRRHRRRAVLRRRTCRRRATRWRTAASA